MIALEVYVIRKDVEWIKIYWNQDIADWVSIGDASVYDSDGADDRSRLLKSDCTAVRLADVATFG